MPIPALWKRRFRHRVGVLLFQMAERERERERERGESVGAANNRRREHTSSTAEGRRAFSPHAGEGCSPRQQEQKIRSPSTIETTKNSVINRTVTAHARWTEPRGSTSQLANNLPSAGMPPRPLLPPMPLELDLPPPPGGGSGVASSSYVLSTDAPSSVVLSSREEEFRGMVVYSIICTHGTRG